MAAVAAVAGSSVSLSCHLPGSLRESPPASWRPQAPVSGVSPRHLVRTLCNSLPEITMVDILLEFCPTYIDFIIYFI